MLKDLKLAMQAAQDAGATTPMASGRRTSMRRSSAKASRQWTFPDHPHPAVNSIPTRRSAERSRRPREARSTKDRLSTAHDVAFDFAQAERGKG